MRLFPATLVCLSLLVPGPAHAQAPALHSLFHDIFDDELKRSPEFASAIGDLRYNDQLSDLSARAFNDALAARQGFLNRILTIDTAGLSGDDQLAAEQVQLELTADLEASRSKPWELPIAPRQTISIDLAGLADDMPFAAVKDYDDYIARLRLVPRQLRQASENLLAGIDEGRVEPASVIEAALQQTEKLAAQTPEMSAFAAPLRKFPASMAPASQKRISAELLDAIQTDVLPAYARFAKFLRVTELPAAGQTPIDPPTVGSQAVQLHILELRNRARTALGPKFDLKGFHDQIVNSWQLPPDRLTQRIDAWIADRIADRIAATK